MLPVCVCVGYPIKVIFGFAKHIPQIVISDLVEISHCNKSINILQQPMFFPGPITPCEVCHHYAHVTPGSRLGQCTLVWLASHCPALIDWLVLRREVMNKNTWTPWDLQPWIFAWVSKMMLCKRYLLLQTWHHFGNVAVKFQWTLGVPLSVYQRFQE